MKKKKSIGDILAEKGILRRPVPSQKDPFEISCEEVQKNLKNFWETPQKLSHSKKARISDHLKKCSSCQKTFVKIQEENPIDLL